MDKGYSEKYWMLVSQASATKPLETDDEDEDEAPSPTPSNRSTPSPAELKQRPDSGELSHKAEERPVSAAKVSDKSAPKTEKPEKSLYAAKVSDKSTSRAEKPEKSVYAAKVSGKATPKVEKPGKSVSATKLSGRSIPKAEKPEKSVSAAKVSGRPTPKAEKSEMSVANVSDKSTPKAEKPEMSVAKVSGKSTPKAEKPEKSVAKVSDKSTPKAEKSEKSVAKVSDKSTPKVEKSEMSVAKVSDKATPKVEKPEKKSSDRNAAHSSHKSEKHGVSTSPHGSPSPADDVIVLAPSDEETDPGLQSDWQEELDYGEDQYWEPGMCPQDTKTMGGLRGTGPTVPEGSSDKERGSPVSMNWAESSPLSSRTGPTLLPIPVEPTPSTSREPTLPTSQEPDPLTGITTSHPLFAVAPDWPQQLGKAAGEAFAEGLRVALKPHGGGKQAADSSPRETGKRRKEDCWGPPGCLEGLVPQGPPTRAVKQNAAAAAAAAVADRENAPVGTKWCRTAVNLNSTTHPTVLQSAHLEYLTWNVNTWLLHTINDSCQRILTSLHYPHITMSVTRPIVSRGTQVWRGGV